MSKFNTTSLQVTVSEATDDYELGLVLTKPMDIANYFRSGFESNDQMLKLDDNQIMDIVKSISKDKPADWDDDGGDTPWNEEAWELTVIDALRDANLKANDRSPRMLPDTRTSVAISGSTVSAVADKFAKNAAFTTSLHNAAYAPEEVKKAPLKLLLSVLDVYGLSVDNYGCVEHVEQSALFSEMPHPESEPSAEYLKDNNNKVKPTDIRKFAKYKIGDETKDFYRDFIYRQPEGKAIMDEVDALKLAMPGKNKKPTGKYSNWAEQKVKNNLNMWQSRENGAIKYMKMAVTCMYQWKDIIDGLGSKVGVRFLMDEDGTTKSRVSEGFSTLQIYDKVAGAKDMTIAMPLSISGFNNLDVEKAIEDGGTYVNLRNSTKRGTKEEKTTAIAWSKEVWLDNVSMIAETLQGATMNELIHAANQRDKATKKRTESAENLIIDMCNLATEFGSFAHLFASDYQKIMNKRREIAQKGAEVAA